MSRKNNRVSRRFESLEGRAMMAGDVSVVSDFNDTLTITGDVEANHVLVESIGNDSIRLTGLPTAGGATTINGQASATFEINGYDAFIQQINANLGDGDDALFFQDSTIETNWAIDTGAGNDDVEFTVTQIRGAVSITGTGVDDVTLDTFFNVDDFTIDVEQVGVVDIQDARIFGDLTIASAGGSNAATESISISAGTSADNIAITLDQAGSASVTDSSGDSLSVVALRGGSHNVNVERFNTNGSVVVDTRGGADTIHMAENSIGGGVTIVSRGGNDSLTFDQVDIAGAVNINTGSGVDTFYADQGEWGATTINLAGGSDNFTMFDVQFLAGMNLRGGGGDDSLFLSGISSDGTVDIRSGGGDDTVDLAFADIGGALNVRLGNGDDELIVRNNTVGEDALWDGGNGFDTLDDNSTTVVGGALTLLRFEDF